MVPTWFYRGRGGREIVGSTDAAGRAAFVPSLSTADHDEENNMTSIAAIPIDDGTAQELSDRLADVFRTGEVGDVLTEDVFLDGHPPLWRFQLRAGTHSLRGSAATRRTAPTRR